MIDHLLHIGVHIQPRELLSESPHCSWLLDPSRTAQIYINTCCLQLRQNTNILINGLMMEVILHAQSPESIYQKVVDLETTVCDGIVVKFQSLQIGQVQPRQIAQGDHFVAAWVRKQVLKSSYYRQGSSIAVRCSIFSIELPSKQSPLRRQKVNSVSCCKMSGWWLSSELGTTYTELVLCSRGFCSFWSAIPGRCPSIARNLPQINEYGCKTGFSGFQPGTSSGVRYPRSICVAFLASLNVIIITSNQGNERAYYTSTRLINLLIGSMRRSEARNTNKSKTIDPYAGLTKEQRLKLDLSTIESSIVRQIENSQLGIAKAQVPFLSEKEKKEQENLLLEKIAQEKKKMQEKLRQLEQSERVHLQKSGVRVSSSLPKSEVTEEDKVTIKQLQKKLIDFQKKVEQKDKQIQQLQLKKIKEEQQRLERQRALTNEHKKAKIQQKLNQIKNRQLQRQKKFRQQMTLIKKLQQRKKLHQILDEDWREKNNQQQQRKYQLMQLRNKDKRIDLESLKQHEKKYQEIIEQKKRELQEKRLSMSRNSPKFMTSLEKSHFYTIIAREQEQAKQQQQKKRRQHQKLLQKRSMYAEYVRQQHAPKVKTIEDEQLQMKLSKAQSQQSKAPRLTHQQIREIGNLNLKLGNKKAKKKQSLDISLNEDKSESTSTSMMQYHDYLRDIRRRREQQGLTFSPRREAEKIMKNSRYDPQDKIAKIRLLASQFDRKQDLLQKVQGKLQILSMLN